MKLTTDNKTEDFGHKKFRFRIDESHAMKAIWALINLYEHKIRTPVQEVISNARDAHREVGKPDHTFDVRVTDNEFIVRDYGSGISPEKAENIFCSIGESTKTNDNSQTGGFGIGAKSPLAYAKQFEMYSYIDGIEYHYVIAKNGEMLDMNLISTSNTSLENGTKVIIPILKSSDLWGRKQNDKKQFIDAVVRCCYFWENRPNFNHDIKPLEVFRLKGMPNYGFYNADHINADLAVIDGIPYFTGNHRYDKSKRVVFYKTGELRVHETRERLADNTEDRDYNFNLIQKDNDLIDKNIYEQINEYIGNDVFKSLRALSEFNISFTYKKLGYTFNSKLIMLDDKSSFDVYTSEKSARYPYPCRYKKQSHNYLKYDTEVFYNKDLESTQKISRRVKAYLNTFASKHMEKSVYVTDDKKLANLFGAKDLSTLEIPKIDKTGVKKQNEEITITEICRYGQNRVYKKLNGVTKDYLYLGFNEETNFSMIKFLECKGYTVCKLSKESIEKVSSHKNFTDYNEFIGKYELSQDEINSIYYGKITKINFNVDYSLLIDNQVKRYYEIRNQYTPCDILNIPEVLYTKNIEDTLKKISAENEEISNIVNYVKKEYRLLGCDKKENTEYINAIYSYRKNLHSLK